MLRIPARVSAKTAIFLFTARIAEVPRVFGNGSTVLTCVRHDFLLVKKG
jgi:hypothetical protein